MAINYKREYELVVSTKTETFTFTGLKIVFNITHDLFGYPQLAKFDVYNIARDRFEQLTEEFNTVVFRAGYEGNMKTIFNGETRNIISLRNGTETITQIYAGNAERAFRESFFSETFAASTPLETIVNAIIGTMEGITAAKLDGLYLTDKKLPIWNPLQPYIIGARVRDASNAIHESLINDNKGNPITLPVWRKIPIVTTSKESFSAPSRVILDELAEEHGFWWSVIDGELYTFGREGALVGEETLVINRNSGMINSPMITEIGADVKILLNPEATPFKLIQIESATPNVSLGDLNFRKVNKTLGAGVYRINKVVHRGDTRGSEWYSEITAKTIAAE